MGCAFKRKDVHTPMIATRLASKTAQEQEERLFIGKDTFILEMLRQPTPLLQ